MDDLYVRIRRERIKKGLWVFYGFEVPAHPLIGMSMVEPRSPAGRRHVVVERVRVNWWEGQWVLVALVHPAGQPGTHTTRELLRWTQVFRGREDLLESARALPVQRWVAACP